MVELVFNVDGGAAVVFGVEDGRASLRPGVFDVGRCRMEGPSMVFCPCGRLLYLVW